MLSILNTPQDPDRDADSPGAMPTPRTTEARELLIDALLAHAREVQADDAKPQRPKQRKPKRRKEDV